MLYIFYRIKPLETLCNAFLLGGLKSKKGEDLQLAME